MVTEHRRLKMREYRKAYEMKYPERVKKSKQKWLDNNKEQRLQYTRDYREKNRDKVRAYNHENNKKRIKFKGKTLCIDHNPRSGKCTKCDRTDMLTNMHHTQYDESDPVAHTIELCVPCHNSEHKRLRNIDK